MIETARLIVDSGLLILIWMVQLIVYPSFLFYRSDQLLNWHRLYTHRIGLVVLPIMFVQLLIAIYQIYYCPNTDSVLYASIVFILWGVTAFKFAPMHGDIAAGNTEKKFLSLLVQLNWIRTILWSILFLLTVVGLLTS